MHNRISIPTSSHHGNINKERKLGNPVRAACQFSFSRPAVHQETQKPGAKCICRLAAVLASPGDFWKNPETLTDQNSHVLHFKHDSEHMIIQ